MLCDLILILVKDMDMDKNTKDCYDRVSSIQSLSNYMVKNTRRGKAVIALATTHHHGFKSRTPNLAGIMKALEICKPHNPEIWHILLVQFSDLCPGTWLLGWPSEKPWWTLCQMLGSWAQLGTAGHRLKTCPANVMSNVQIESTRSIRQSLIWSIRYCKYCKMMKWSLNLVHWEALKVTQKISKTLFFPC